MDKFPKQTVDHIIAEQYAGDSMAFLREIEDYIKTVPVPNKKKPVNPAGPVLIELKHVARAYKLNRKNTVQAVQGVDLTIHEGEIVALTGPSGSGKSTLMHLIAGLDRPSEGEVLVDGRLVSKLSEGKLARYRNEMVGIVFQFFYLQPFLKVDRNVEVPLMFARSKRNTRRPAIEEVVEAVSLGDRAGFFPKELSGGQMQRVAIARALVNKPKILLADEPTGNLDSKNSDAIMQLLQAIREHLGTTMIIVTHDPRVAAWADRIIRLEDGRIMP
ncbi:MAG TPA: ABC transporter ATP-binding protein [Candidatus Saccharimonadales bacterium]|nr:ABC transporter ATP-binding protein [Candidatus Saccharimonadales bacterium]